MAAPSFAAGILPLFTAIDIAHMAHGGVMLAEYGYMSNSGERQGCARSFEWDGRGDHAAAAGQPLVCRQYRAVQSVDGGRVSAITVDGGSFSK